MACGPHCDVWCATLPSLEPRHVALLDPVERVRRTAYRHRADADRFTLGRAMVRIVVGAALRIAATDVRLDSTCATCGEPHGKPRARNNGAPEVSITHAGERVLVAVSSMGAVGVDVEAPGSRLGSGGDISDLVADVLTPGERAHLRRIPPQVQHAAFLRAWTRKEALVKATGHGLLDDLRTIEVSASDESARVLSSSDPGHPPESFSLADLPLPDGYVASVAVLLRRQGSVDVRLRDAEPLLRRWKPGSDRVKRHPMPTSSLG